MLVIKHLNSFSLERKLGGKNKHEVIYIIWKEFMPQAFYRHICKEKNFLYINGENLLQPKVSEIITEFLAEKDENYKQLRNNLSHSKNIFQYVYSNVFPEIYCSIERRGFNLKSNFHIIFKTYKDKKNVESSLVKTLTTMRVFRTKHLYMSKSLLKLMGFMKLKRK